MLENIVTILVVVFVLLFMFLFFMNSLSYGAPSQLPTQPKLYEPLHRVNDLLAEEDVKLPNEETSHKAPTLCEAKLNQAPTEEIYPSSDFNEHPQLVNFPSSCTPHPKPNIDAPMVGTGVGEPAYADVNEFPSEYESTPLKKCGLHSRKAFDVDASDIYNETNGFIDYPVSLPPISGLACQRSTGVGQPYEENKHGAFASY
jgi:hypothetical protein